MKLQPHQLRSACRAYVVLVEDLEGNMQQLLAGFQQNIRFYQEDKVTVEGAVDIESAYKAVAEMDFHLAHHPILVSVSDGTKRWIKGRGMVITDLMLPPHLGVQTENDGGIQVVQKIGDHIAVVISAAPEVCLEKVKQYSLEDKLKLLGLWQAGQFGGLHTKSDIIGVMMALVDAHAQMKQFPFWIDQEYKLQINAEALGLNLLEVVSMRDVNARLLDILVSAKRSAEDS